MRTIAQSVFFFVCAFSLIGYAQDKAAKTPAPTPTPDPMILTDTERREIAPLLQEDQSLVIEKQEAESKLLTTANGDASGFEARARELKDILTRQGAWQQRYQAWLQGARARAKCPDCLPNFQAGRLVRPVQNP